MDFFLKKSISCIVLFVFTLSFVCLFIPQAFSYEIDPLSPLFEIKNANKVNMLFMCHNSGDVKGINVVFESNFRETETGFYPIRTDRSVFPATRIGGRRVSIPFGKKFELSPGINRIVSQPIYNENIYGETEEAFIALSIDSLQVSIPPIHYLKNEERLKHKIDEAVKNGKKSPVLYLLQTIY